MPPRVGAYRLSAVQVPLAITSAELVSVVLHVPLIVIFPPCSLAPPLRAAVISAAIDRIARSPLPALYMPLPVKLNASVHWPVPLPLLEITENATAIVLPDCEIYTTDWHNARDIPVSAGDFDVELIGREIEVCDYRSLLTATYRTFEELLLPVSKA